MANDSMNRNQNDSPMGEKKSQNSGQNQTMQHEQAKASIGGERQGEQGGLDKNRQSEQGLGKDGQNEKGWDKSRDEKSAIGGGENRGQTGEPGRARSELDEKSRSSETTGQR